MKKIGMFCIYAIRVVWMVVMFIAAMWVMYVTAKTLDVAIPSGTNVWIRMAIGFPCLTVAPVSVELLLIAISRKLDRHGWLGIQ